MNSPQLPRHLSQIDAVWLSAAMKRRYPGVDVLSAEQDEVIASTATKLGLKLRYNEAGREAGLADRVILKGGLYGHAHERQLYPLYRNEARFYRDVAPGLPIDLPACYFADTDDETGLIILEDLSCRQCAFGKAAMSLERPLVEQALDYQARYHARFWNRGAAIDRWNLMSVHGFLSGFFAEPWLTDFEPPNGRFPSEMLATVDAARRGMSDRAYFKTLMMTLDAFNASHTQCLIHFDTHVGNMYFDARGQPRWLDWQLASRYSPAWDVSYFMIGALSPADRRAHERELLAFYLDRLRMHGADTGVPTLDSLWLAYRQNAIWGLAWAIVPEVMQSHANAFPVIEKFWYAVKELETISSLGLAPKPDWE